MKQFSEGEFLNKKYPDLKRSEQVESCTEASDEEVLDKTEHWLKATESFHKRHRDDPESMDHIRNAFYDKYVIKPENVPDSYFENQQRMVRELGHGDIEVTEEAKEENIKIIISDQKTTLDKWTDYLFSDDADVYPMFAKYWILRSMPKLSSYDKEKGSFGNRRKDTVSPFPDLDQEALAHVIDTIVKKVNQEKIEDAEDNPELQKLIQSENFGKLYAYEIEKINSAEGDELLTTEGEWIKYPQNSDHLSLVESLQEHRTGWCIAAESTARTYLKEGDLYVYYSNDRDNEPTVPRVAIRMEGNQIGEIRGIAPDQNLDNEIQDVLDEKLSEFPDKEKYQKKTADMKFLTQIEKKKEELNTDELRFLYEIDSKIKGFGYKRDPRIEEIKEERNQYQDYALMFECRPDQIALSEGELRENTVVFNDSLYLRKGPIEKLTEGLTSIAEKLHLRKSQTEKLPESLIYIGGSLHIGNGQIKELPENLTFIGEDLYIGDSQIKKLPEGLASIGRDLHLRDSQIRKLPESLISIGRDLDARDSQIEKLPDGLVSIGRHLYLTNSQIKKLPGSPPFIGGNLHLGDQIKELPDSLISLNGSLYLSGTQIEKLPDGLVSIGKTLHLGESQIKELPENLAFIGRDLYLRDSQIKKLPENLAFIGGSLEFGNSQIEKLPENLASVGGNLDLRDSQVKKIPENLTYVGRNLYLKDSQVEKLPTNIENIVKGDIVR